MAEVVIMGAEKETKSICCLIIMLSISVRPALPALTPLLSLKYRNYPPLTSQNSSLAKVLSFLLLPGTDRHLVNFPAGLREFLVCRIVRVVIVLAAAGQKRFSGARIFLLVWNTEREREMK